LVEDLIKKGERGVTC